MAVSTTDVAGMVQASGDFIDAAYAKATASISALEGYATAEIDTTYLPTDRDGYAYVDSMTGDISQIKAVDDMITEVDTLAASFKTVSDNYVLPVDIGAFKMEDHKIWKDDFADEIETTLSDYIKTMGIPNKDYQDAIFNEDYDRNLLILNDLYDLADAKVGARGFTYNNDQSTALKLDAQVKYQFDRTQVSRNISKLVTEWARQNYQFAVEKGIAFEQFHADFTYKYCTAYVEIYKNLVLASIERFKANIAKYLEPIKAIIEASKLQLEVSKLNTDIDKMNADITAADNARKISEALKVFETRIDAGIKMYAEQIKASAEASKQLATMAQASSRAVFGIQKK